MAPAEPDARRRSSRALCRVRTSPSTLSLTGTATKPHAHDGAERGGSDHSAVQKLNDADAHETSTSIPPKGETRYHLATVVQE